MGSGCLHGLDSFNRTLREGAAQLTIIGRNFGISDSKPVASVGGRPCTATTWVSDSSIACEGVPARFGASPGIGVSVLGTTIAGDKYAFAYDPPKPVGAERFNAPMTGPAGASPPSRVSRLCCALQTNKALGILRHSLVHFREQVRHSSPSLVSRSAPHRRRSLLVVSWPRSARRSAQQSLG